MMSFSHRFYTRIIAYQFWPDPESIGRYFSFAITINHHRLTLGALGSLEVYRLCSLYHLEKGGAQWAMTSSTPSRISQGFFGS
jgi:hypothetical protein